MCLLWVYYHNDVFNCTQQFGSMSAINRSKSSAQNNKHLNWSEWLRVWRRKFWLVSTHVVCKRLSMMQKQVSGWTVNFCPNFPESPFLEFQTRKPPLPISENFRFEMTKVCSRIPPHILENFRFEMTKVYSGIPDLPPPHFGKLQMWDDQSLLWNTPPPLLENFRFEMTKVYSGIPSPFRKTSDLRWLRFTPEYPPPFSENAGDRMWRLICNPQGYHSFHLLTIFLELRNVVFFIFHSKYRSSQSVHLMIAAGVDFFLVIVLEDGKKHPSHKIKTSCTDINSYRYMLHFCQIAFDFLVTFWAIKHKIRKSNV